jgi:hypothetical protein
VGNGCGLQAAFELVFQHQHGLGVLESLPFDGFSELSPGLAQPLHQGSERLGNGLYFSGAALGQPCFKYKICVPLAHLLRGALAAPAQQLQRRQQPVAHPDRDYHRGGYRPQAQQQGDQGMALTCLHNLI